MILVTGGTGFIGQALIRQLIVNGHSVRTLLRPSQHTPRLPKGISVDAVVSSLLDERGVRAAMNGVDTVFHLAGGENQGSHVDLLESDIQSTQVLTHAAIDSGIKRIVYLSHLSADRASAYPVLKAKGIAENTIKNSGLTYTIFRSAVVFGPGDHFSEGLRAVLAKFPMIFILPGDGATLLQPIHVEDLTNCMVWALEDSNTINQTYEVGGGEYLSLRRIVEIIMDKTGIKRNFVELSPSYLRILTVTLESMVPVFPLSTFWLDYLAADRTCPQDSLPRYFGIMPARFAQKIDYLQETPIVSASRKKIRRHIS